MKFLFKIIVANLLSDGFYNFIKNEIDGTIHFFEKNDVVVKAQLKGKINNPEVLVGGKIFSENEGATTSRH